jgi:hypothetical protein
MRTERASLTARRRPSCGDRAGGLRSPPSVGPGDGRFRSSQNRPEREGRFVFLLLAAGIGTAGNGTFLSTFSGCPSVAILLVIDPTSHFSEKNCPLCPQRTTVWSGIMPPRIQSYCASSVFVMGQLFPCSVRLDREPFQSPVPHHMRSAHATIPTSESLLAKPLSSGFFLIYLADEVNWEIISL